jgi:hypothetical protein
MIRWPPYFEWDIQAAGLLPTDWQKQIRLAIVEDGISTVLSEDLEHSEQNTDASFSVLVVTGEPCARRMPWLRQLYQHDLLAFAAKSFGRPLFVATDTQSSININCLRGVGARYGTHKDSNSVTGVLFASDANKETGGQLVFERENDSDAVIWPRSGIFIAFDAREIPHFVAPLRTEMDRISVPMNFYDHPTLQHRPNGLDDRLYTPR